MRSKMGGGDELRCADERLPGFFQGIDKPCEFLSGMGDGNIIVFALSAFFCKIRSEGWLPVADVFGRIEQRISKVS